jgi:4-alpha-glucanotransferase
MEKEKKSESIRKSGILVHPTSFPSSHGIGDLGNGAYEFIDFLYASNQKLWQILPLGPTGFGDSPYQSFSSFAGQPLLISPDVLRDEGLLSDTDFMLDWNTNKVDYGSVINYKFTLYKKAFYKFQSNPDSLLTKKFIKFCNEQKSWLFNYSLFMAIKDYHNGIRWTEWEEEIAFPTDESIKKWSTKLETEIKFYQFIQFHFYKQWFKLKDYANERNIEIIGDIPIFVAFDSSDVWSNKQLYYLDEKGYPTHVAGVPPDYFSETGQLWGNPLYNWEKHKESNYSWWIERISHSLNLVDILRIDHFRGFEAYWAIPYKESTAVNGKWVEGPYKDLFTALESAIGINLPIIAEDLGIITDKVKELRDSFNFPGMKILQFGFEDIEDNDFLPHNFNPNSICYSGTHDNDTTLGWYLKTSEKSRDKVRRYMNTDGMNISWDFIRTCFCCVSNMAVVPLQDVLSLDSFYRTNTPGTTENNWVYRYTQNMLSDNIIERLASITKLSGR